MNFIQNYTATKPCDWWYKNVHRCFNIS